MTITIIGHGSLMSGRGLSFSGALQVQKAAIAALPYCRRGFAKLSRYGDRFATDLDPIQLPLIGRTVTVTAAATQEVEGLALTVSLTDACRLSQREGYNPTTLHQLADMAQAAGLNLAEFLWRLAAEGDHQVIPYRRRLLALTGFTSPHYIPHPVCLDDNDYALVFLAPGLEGTGSDEVISVRQQTRITTLMSTAETWRQKPNEEQLSYFLSCLLAGAHGINVRDILSTIHEAPELAAALSNQLSLSLQQEYEQFLTATGFTAIQYRHLFGEPLAALTRSGLAEFCENGG